MTRVFNLIAICNLAAFAMFGGCGQAATNAQLAVGDMAPTFTLPDQDGVARSLSDYRGQNVLVYFYPKDFTSGCTTQACGIRDEYDDYRAAGITVLGISGDSPESHKAFEKEHGLPFTLLSDKGLKVAAHYGADGVLDFARRYSFLINEEGKIIAMIHDVNVRSHSTQVLNLFKETGQE